MHRSIRSVLLFALVAASFLPASAGTLVVANKSEATVSLVNTETGDIRATLPTGNAPHEVDVSPNGRFAVVGNYGTRDEPGSSLTVIDVPAATVVKTIDLGDYSRPHGIVWMDDETVLVTAEENQALIRVEIESGEVVQTIPTDAEISHMVAVARDHGLAFVANIGSGSVTVIDLALGMQLATIPTGEGAEGITVTPHGRQVWITNRADDLSVFSANEKKELGRVKFTAVSKGDKGRLFSDRFGDSSVPIGIEIVDSERRAYIAHANADDISIVDLSEWKVVGTLSAGKEPDGMGFSPLTPKDESEAEATQE